MSRAKSRGRNYRTSRTPQIESLEPRQLLSVTVAPSLSVDADHVAAGSTVGVYAAMPSTATGSISYTVGSGSPVSEPLNSVNALQVDGDGGGVHTSLQLDPVSTPSMTISAWVRIDGPTSDTSTYNSVAGCFDGADGGFWPGFGFDSSGQWYVQAGDSTWGTGVSADTTGGGWHFVAAVFSATDIQFYYDGALVSRGSPGNWGTYASAGGGFTIGYDAASGSPQGFNGAINDVGVWQSALNGTQMSQLWNNGIGIGANYAAYPDAADMAAGWHLTDSPDSTTATDFTGHGHDGTLVGDANFTTGGGFQAVATLPDHEFSDAGDIPITAAYAPSGDSIGVYASATAYYTETVLGATMTTLGSLSSPVDQGASEELVATVTPGVTGGAAATGVVDFTDGSVDLGAAPLVWNSLTSTGTATLYTTSILVGSQSITATYEGDGTYAASLPSTAASITVLPVVSPMLNVSASTVVAYGSVTLTATMPSGATGGVEFYDNNDSIGSASLTDPPFEVTDLAAGAHSFTAVYTSGTDDPYAGGGTSPARAVVVLPTTLPDEVVNDVPNQSATPSPTVDGSLVLPFAPAGLNYVSGSSGLPIVSVDAPLPGGGSGTLTGVTATLYLGDSDTGTAVGETYYAATDITGATGSSDGMYRFAIKYTGAPLDTGRYQFTIAIAPSYSGSSPSAATATVCQNVLNRNSSPYNADIDPFGSGWWLDGLDYLVANSSPAGISLVQSDGTIGFFTSSDGTNYTGEAGPFAFMKITKVTVGEDEAYQLTGTDGTMETFDASSGRLLSVTDRDGNVTAYSPFDPESGFTITDPAGHVTTYSLNESGTLVTAITDFALRETDLSYNGNAQLETVTQPNPDVTGEEQPVSHFYYDSTNGLLSSYVDANGNAMQFAYRPDGTLATATAADGTTTNYQSALSPPLAGDSTAGEGDAEVPTVSDAGFESPDVSGGFEYDPTGSAWTFTDGAAIAASGSAFMATTDPPLIDGEQTAALQNISGISQVLDFPAAGSFAVAFQSAARTGYGTGNSFDVYIDDTLAGTFLPTNTTAFADYQTAFVSVSAGYHTLKFEGLHSGGDETSYVDNVSIVAAAPTVGDAGFESPDVGDGFSGYQVDPTAPPWTFSGDAAIAANGSAYLYSSYPVSEDGDQVAVLQNISEISQVLDFPATGSFAVAFQSAARTFYGTGNTFNVYIDDTLAGTFLPTNTTAFADYQTNFVALTAGSHTISFQGLDPDDGDESSYVDNVSIVLAAPAGSAGNPANLVPSATAVGVVTDQNGSPTVISFDKFGDPTSVENALGAMTIYVRPSEYMPSDGSEDISNIGDLVTQIIQPSVLSGYSMVSPTTDLGYDSGGNLTSQANPDGSSQYWDYTSFDTLGGNYVVPTQWREDLATPPAGTLLPLDQVESFIYVDPATEITYTYSYAPEMSAAAGTPIYSLADLPSSLGLPGSNYMKYSRQDGWYDWYEASPIATDPGTLMPLGATDVQRLPVHVVNYTYFGTDETGGNLGDLKSVAQMGDAYSGSPMTQYTYTTATSPGGSCPAGLVLTSTDPDGNTTYYTYFTSDMPDNRIGLLTALTYPSNAETPPTSVYYAYDSTTAELTSVSNPVATGTEGPVPTTYYAYDGLGREVSETDPPDANGNQPETVYSYDPMGNVTSQQVLQAVSNSDEVWQNTTYTYNTLEQLSEVDAPGPDGSSTAAVTLYSYTPTGMPYQLTDANNSVTTYGYDAIGEQTSVNLPDPATGLPGGPTIYTTYDALGRMTRQTSPLPPGTDLSDEIDGTTYFYTFGTSTSPGVTVTTTLPNVTSGATGEGPHTTDFYDPDGNLVSESAPSAAWRGNDTTTYFYDALGRPAQQYLSGHELGPTFDGDGNVIGDTDLVNGAVTHYVYNARNELVQTIAPDPDPSTAIERTRAGNESTPGGDDWSDQDDGYDADAKASSDPEATATYDFTDLTAGQQYAVLATWVPGTGNTTSATYTLSAGGSGSGTVDQTVTPVAHRNYGGVDWQVLLTFTADSDGTAVVTLSNTGGSDTLVADGVQIAPVGPVATDTYDAAGSLASQTDPSGATETIDYDNLERPITDTVPNPAGGDPVPTTTGYDLVGNVISTTYPSPVGDDSYVTTTNTYDQQNNLESATDANGDVTTFAHNALGDTLSLTDSDGNTTSWGVNHLGQTTSQSQVVALGYFPDGTVQTALATSYNLYDSAGNLATSIDADHRSITYTLDHLFEETRETWTDAAGNTVGGVAYSYNPAGYMTEASNTWTNSPTTEDPATVADYNYAYTTAGNVQVENISLGAMSMAVTLASTYDYNNNRTTLAANINYGSVTPTFNGNGTISFSSGYDDFENTYTYNTLGDMTSVQQLENQSTDEETHNAVTSKYVALGYDSADQLSTIDMYQNDDDSTGLVAHAAYDYNAASELSDLKYTANSDGTGTVLAGYHWDYNAAGAVSDMYSHNDSNATTPNNTFTGTGSNWGEATYSYDPTAQLLGASYSTYFANPPTTDAGKTYDPNGNRTSVTPASPTTTTTGADNRLLYDGTYYYNYDAEGNRTAQYKITSGSDKTLGTPGDLNPYATDITIYAWDNANQLVGVKHYADYSAYGTPGLTPPRANGRSPMATTPLAGW